MLTMTPEGLKLYVHAINMMDPNHALVTEERAARGAYVRSPALSWFEENAHEYTATLRQLLRQRQGDSNPGQRIDERDSRRVKAHAPRLSPLGDASGLPVVAQHLHHLVAMRPVPA